MIRDSGFRGPFAGVLCALLLVPTPALPAEIVDAAAPRRLEVVVLEGEGAINDLRQRVAHDTVIEVRDENQRPLKNAAVSVALPTTGASGEFSNGASSTTLSTDNRGRVVLRGMKVRTPGTLAMQINASYHGVTGRAVATQFNMMVPGTKGRGSGAKKTIVILTLAAAAAAGGMLASTRKSGTSAPAAAVSVPIGISPGTGTVGAPK